MSVHADLCTHVGKELRIDELLLFYIILIMSW